MEQVDALSEALGKFLIGADLLPLPTTPSMLSVAAATPGDRLARTNGLLFETFVYLWPYHRRGESELQARVLAERFEEMIVSWAESKANDPELLRILECSSSEIADRLKALTTPALQCIASDQAWNDGERPHSLARYILETSTSPTQLIPAIWLHGKPEWKRGWREAAKRALDVLNGTELANPRFLSEFIAMAPRGLLAVIPREQETLRLALRLPLAGPNLMMQAVAKAIGSLEAPEPLRRQLMSWASGAFPVSMRQVQKELNACSAGSPSEEAPAPEDLSAKQIEAVAIALDDPQQRSHLLLCTFLHALNSALTLRFMKSDSRRDEKYYEPVRMLLCEVAQRSPRLRGVAEQICTLQVVSSWCQDDDNLRFLLPAFSALDVSIPDQFYPEATDAAPCVIEIDQIRAVTGGEAFPKAYELGLLIADAILDPIYVIERQTKGSALVNADLFVYLEGKTRATESRDSYLAPPSSRKTERKQIHGYMRMMASFGNGYWLLQWAIEEAKLQLRSVQRS